MLTDAIARMDDFQWIDRVFAMNGRKMRRHEGRSVVRLRVDGRRCYLKRYWLVASQVFQGHVARGLHELRMIDWLHANGFAGPRVVARGVSRGLGVATRLFFLMEEQVDEAPLERTWWDMPEASDSLLHSLASFAARLHDAGFVHTDFSERHIFVGRRNEAWTFRLIDVERARVYRSGCRRRERRAMADLKTLAASIADQALRERIEGSFFDDYLSQRRTLAHNGDMRRLFREASATRRFR